MNAYTINRVVKNTDVEVNLDCFLRIRLRFFLSGQGKDRTRGCGTASQEAKTTEKSVTSKATNQSLEND